MPTPSPTPGEAQGDFVSRCMGDSTMRSDYPDQGQRAAVCHRQWDSRKKDTASNALLFLEQERKR